MLTLVVMTLAAEPDCEACCRRVGVADCEMTLRVVGEESRTQRDRGGTRVEGLYVVGCDGRAFFDDDRLAYFMGTPTAGELAMPESDPRAVECFLEACRLPRDACVTHPDSQGRRHLQNCATATALDA